MIHAINPDIKLCSIQQPLISPASFNAIKNAGFVFSSVDNDGARLVLNELCLAYDIPFLDVASDVHEDEYGGHVISIFDEQACLYCLGE